MCNKVARTNDQKVENPNLCYGFSKPQLKLCALRALSPRAQQGGKGSRFSAKNRELTVVNCALRVAYQRLLPPSGLGCDLILRVLPSPTTPFSAPTMVQSNVPFVGDCSIVGVPFAAKAASATGRVAARPSLKGGSRPWSPNGALRRRRGGGIPP